MKPTDIPVGTRFLHVGRFYHTQPSEATLVEWSPSGKHVKLRNVAGIEYWLSAYDTEELRVVEILQPRYTPVGMKSTQIALYNKRNTNGL